MDKLRKTWYLIVNGVVFLATLVIYFIYVAGASDQELEMVDKLDRSRRIVTSLARQKPTPAWFEQLDENIELVTAEKDKLFQKLRERDDSLNIFYSLENRSQTTVSIPPAGRYPEFKELMQAKWSELIAKYSSEDSKLSCAPSILTGLEPTWLRSVHTPSSELQVREAMKRYWIAKEILAILSAHGALSLRAFEMGKNVAYAQYKRGDELFWGVRDVKIVANIDAKKFSELLSSFHGSDFKFRVLSFDLKNVIDSPFGVTSDVNFVSFRDPELHEMTLKLSHFDLSQEDEVLSFGGEGASPGAGIEAGGRRRRR